MWRAEPSISEEIMRVDNRGNSNAALCHAYDLGIIDYNKALRLQEQLVKARFADYIPDTVLFLQHPPVLAIGAAGGEENIIADSDVLAEEGIAVVRTDRGGNITVHEPGQLVGYPIFNLDVRGRDLHQYVRNLEEVVIRTLRDYSIAAHRNSRQPGVWVGEDKVCALGIRVSRWVTKHGFALNVNNELKGFSHVHPCGITNGRVTSISRLTGHNVTIEEVMPNIIEHFTQVFNVALHIEPADNLGKFYVN